MKNHSEQDGLQYFQPSLSELFIEEDIFYQEMLGVMCPTKRNHRVPCCSDLFSNSRSSVFDGPDAFVCSCCQPVFSHLATEDHVCFSVILRILGSLFMRKPFSPWASYTPSPNLSRSEKSDESYVMISASWELFR